MMLHYRSNNQDATDNNINGEFLSIERVFTARKLDPQGAAITRYEINKRTPLERFITPGRLCRHNNDKNNNNHTSTLRAAFQKQRPPPLTPETQFYRTKHLNYIGSVYSRTNTNSL